MNVKELLQARVESQLKAMDGLKIGSDEYESAAGSLTKMLDKLNEMEENEFNHKSKIEDREKDTELKLKQMAEDRKDNIIKNCLTGFSVAGGLALTVWGTLKSFEFEKTGTVTTIMGRGFINKLLPKK